MRSLSPRHFEASVAEETLKNVVPHSVATALASNVFPVPGGPNIRTPFQGLRIPYKERSNKFNPTNKPCPQKLHIIAGEKHSTQGDAEMLDGKDLAPQLIVEN
jgi:hypothetical protein